MKRVFFGLAAVLWLSGSAGAAEALSDDQMEAMTAGFSASAIADAQALGKVVSTATATLAQVGPVLGGEQVTIDFAQTAWAPLQSLAVQRTAAFPSLP